MSLVFLRSISRMGNARLLCSNAASTVHQLSLEQAQDFKGKGNMLIDVREPRELKDNGAVPGAVNIPLGYVDEAFSMDDERFRVIVGADKPHPDQPIAFFCVKGIRAKKAADLVSGKFQYSNVAFYTNFNDLV